MCFYWTYHAKYDWSDIYINNCAMYFLYWELYFLLQCKMCMYSALHTVSNMLQNTVIFPNPQRQCIIDILKQLYFCLVVDFYF